MKRALILLIAGAIMSGVAAYSVGAVRPSTPDLPERDLPDRDSPKRVGR